MSFEVAQERRKQTGRNDVCPCGSGAKYKKCHQQEDDAIVAAELKRRDAAALAEAAAKAAEAEEAGEGKTEGKADEARGRSGTRAGAGPKRGGARSTAVGKAQNLPRRGAV